MLQRSEFMRCVRDLIRFRIVCNVLRNRHAPMQHGVESTFSILYADAVIEVRTAGSNQQLRTFYGPATHRAREGW